MDQTEQHQQLVPGAAPLVHRVRMEGGILAKAGMETAHTVVRFVEGAGGRVVPGRDQAAVLCVEQEHQPHQHGQQSFVEVFGALPGQDGSGVGCRGVEAAQQVVQGAEHLGGERGGDAGLGAAAGHQQRGQAPALGVVEQAEAVEQELERPQHSAPGRGAQRT